MLDESTMRRLAFIRYLYVVGVEQSRGPEPLTAASVLTFHDSIELFLQLASEHLNVGTKSPSFMEYWDVLETRLQGRSLAQRESMRRLNKSRIALKHHGTLPSNLDIEAFRASATNFFEENTPVVFGIEFSSVSMLNLVSCEEARCSLEKANKLIEEERRTEALDEIASGFDQLVDDYERRKITSFGRSPFFFGEPLTFETSFFMGIKDRDFARFVDKVRDSIDAMRNGVKILSLGLDYRRYVRFRLLTSKARRLLRTQDPNLGAPQDQHPSADECRFCYDFVVESAIRLQDFDFAVITE